MHEHAVKRIASALLSQTDALLATPHNLIELEAYLPGSFMQLSPASVLCGLVSRESGLQVLLTKRAEHLRHHAGQISFPGGRIEAGDVDPYQAALREAQEEIGLQAESVSFIGYLDPMVTITGFKVYPVVALISPDYVAEPDGVEVSDLFEVPLALFLDAGNEKPFVLEFQSVTRRLIEFQWLQHRIWGATASMLINLRQRLGALP